MNIQNTKPADRWSWWRQALKGTVGPMSTTPEQGFYRVRRKGGDWEPVSLWIDETTGLWHARRNDRPVEDPERLWEFCRGHPVSHEAYRQAILGEGWNDEPPPAAGHNLPDIADAFERLRQEFFAEREQAEEFMANPVRSQADADRIGTWARRILDIAGRIEAERKIEKEPFLKAGKEVDAKWMPLHDDTKSFVDRMRGHVREWLIARKREAEAKAQPGEVVKASAGRTGARVSVRTERRAVIVDYDACLAALKNHPTVIDAVERLAQHAVRDGHELPGVEVQIVEKVI